MIREITDDEYYEKIAEGMESPSFHPKIFVCPPPTIMLPPGTSELNTPIVQEHQKDAMSRPKKRKLRPAVVQEGT